MKSLMNHVNMSSLILFAMFGCYLPALSTLDILIVYLKIPLGEIKSIKFANMPRWTYILF